MFCDEMLRRVHLRRLCLRHHVKSINSYKNCSVCLWKSVQFAQWRRPVWECLILFFLPYIVLRNICCITCILLSINYFHNGTFIILMYITHHFCLFWCVNGEEGGKTWTIERYMVKECRSRLKGSGLVG